MPSAVGLMRGLGGVFGAEAAVGILGDGGFGFGAAAEEVGLVGFGVGDFVGTSGEEGHEGCGCEEKGERFHNGFLEKRGMPRQGC